MNFTAIAQQFCGFYYPAFDANRASVAAVYQPNSMLTFVDSQVQGAEAIVKHLVEGVKFGSIQHNVLSLDAQPTAQGILVFVTGHVKVDGGANPLYFSEVFNLMPLDATGANFYVLNQVFKLNYG